MWSFMLTQVGAIIIILLMSKLKELSNLPEVTELMSGGCGIWTQAAGCSVLVLNHYSVQSHWNNKSYSESFL